MDSEALITFAAGVLVALAIVFLAMSMGGGDKAAPAAAASSAPVTVAAPSIPNKKKKSKSKKSKPVAAAAAEAAPVAAHPAVKAAPAAAQPAAKVAAKRTPAPVAAPAPVPTSTPAPVATTSSSSGEKKETPEERADRLERQRARKEAKQAEEAAARRAVIAAAEAAAAKERTEAEHRRAAAAATTATAATYAEAEAGWTVVKQSKGAIKKANAKKDAAAAAVAALERKASGKDEPVAAAAPVVPELATTEVTIEARKIGVVIGPKGATLHAIEAATGARVNLPARERGDEAPVVATITGPDASLAPTKNAIEELCSKGYAKLLAGEDFMESNVVITGRTRSALFNGGGAALKAIQSKLQVKINFPPQPPKPTGPTPVRNLNETTKVSVAGTKEAVMATKGCLKELAEFHHTELTHPGFTHNEIDVPQHLYNVIIGTRGSEIKHIQGNFKVSVYIPDASSEVGVLVVGPSAGVEQASRYISKVVDAAIAAAAVAAAAVDNTAWEAQAEPDEKQPEWMDQYDFAKRKEAQAAQDAVNSKAPGAPDAGPSDAAPTPQEALAWGTASGGGAEGWTTL